MTVERVAAHSAAMPFNRWVGIAVVSADESEVVLRLPYREDLCQNAGGLHAGVILGLLENACGFAAGLHIGPGVVTHFDSQFLRPAHGEAFVAVGRVLKAGRRQAFSEADAYIEVDGARGPLFATARATLVPTGTD
ncbi:PaaI family thioesterase [Tsukamurella sp. 1534]|uniref:PaaI family thioesterase n=1 Tax=Tsukamurella sp. 1534 TaxID=1151061 RepID=UPI0002E7614A|nr:PaaI family thioesterase [Tsukamurella sp. 1534]